MERVPEACSLLQIDYDIRVSTSPSIKTVCEVGFLCGQSAVIWLEANPSLKVLTFDDLGYGASAKCLEFIQSRYPGRLELIQAGHLSCLGCIGQRCRHIFGPPRRVRLGTAVLETSSPPP